MTLAARLLQSRLMRIVGESMAPGLRSGEVVLVHRRAYETRQPRRGELVAARPAALDGRAVVKRLAAVPGEAFITDDCRWRLGPDEFFLLGDAASRSSDSRRFGPVARQELIGQVWARCWPWGVLANENRGGSNESVEVS